MNKNLLNKLWLRVGMIVAIMTTALAGTVKADTTETLTISSYATANSWTNNTQYLTATVGSVTFTATGGNNTGKYYTNDNSWRFYANETAKLTISVPSGSTLVSVKPTFTVKDNGTLVYNNSTQTSGSTINVSGQSVEFSISQSSGTKGKVFFTEIEVTYSTGGSSAVATTTTIDDSGLTNTDVFTSTAAGTLTASVTAGGSAVSGATVTWSSSDTGVATVAASGAVTLVAAGTTTITANYAGVTNQYQSSSATYTLTVTDSTPFDGVIFDATEDTGTSPIVKENVSFACSNGVLNNGSEYRMYKNSTTTISTTDGSLITKIEFTGVSGNPASGFGSQTGWSTSGNNGVWEGEAESVSFTASGAQVRATLIKVTVVANTNPSITASNVDIAYDVTSGSITYNVSNPVSGGVVTAATNDNWLTLGTVGETIPFTCEANTETTDRTATVTLTYAYGSETVTKDVIVTQAGNPNAPGTQNNPYTVAQALAATPASGSTGFIYVSGIVSQIVTPYDSQYGKISYNISDDGENTTVLLAYRGKGLNNTDFSSADDVQVGDVVTIYGKLKTYNGTKELDTGNYLIAQTHPAVAAPTFSPAGGIFDEAQTVTITCATGGATIYYTTDGSAPTNESTEYTGAITVSSTMTINAIAVKDGNQSLVSTATYTIFTFEDGVFFFEAKMSDYGSGIETTSVSDYYETDASTWTAGNVTLVASGKYRWWDNGGELRFYTHDDPQSSMTISVPSGKVITNIVITGGTGFEADCGTYTSGTWTGVSQTVVFTYNATSAQNVKKVTVTYGDQTITISSVGYTTYVAPFDISELPTGVEAYACQIQTNSVHLEPVTAIPAGTAVVLKNAGTYTFTPATSSVSLGVDNDLLPSNGNVQGGANIYALANKTNGVGFYPVSSEIKVPAGKGYLNMSSHAVKAFYGFDDEDDPTGISTMDNGQWTMDNVIYNVAGQRLQKMQKGINIVNGKKIAIK